MIQRWAIAAGGYVAAMVLLGLFIGAKSDIKAEIERCNTEKLAIAQEATEALGEAQKASYEARIEELEAMALSESNARRIAEKAAREAQNCPERVRTVIREVASAEACIDTVVPAVVLDSLRN